MKKALLLLILLPFLVNAQSRLPKAENDSLWALWHDASQPDDVSLQALNRIAWAGYLYSQPDSAFFYAQMLFDEAEARGSKKFMAEALNTQASYFQNIYDYDQAIELYHRSLELRKEISYKMGVAQSLNNMAYLKIDQRKFPEALELLAQSLAINEELGDSAGLALNYANLGGIHFKQDDYAKASEYHTMGLELCKALGDLRGYAEALNSLAKIAQSEGDLPRAIDIYAKCLKISEELDDKFFIAGTKLDIGNIYMDELENQDEKAMEYYRGSLEAFEAIEEPMGVAYALNNIGNVYLYRKEYVKARDHFLRAYELYEAYNYKEGIGGAGINLASISFERGEYDTALEYLTQSLELMREISSRSGEAQALVAMANIFRAKKAYAKAVEYGEQGIGLAQEIGDLNVVKESAKILWETYKEVGNHTEGLAMYELYITTRDSLTSEENQKAVIRQEFKYEYEKQAAADSVQAAEAQKVTDAQLAAQEAQLKQEATQRYALFGGLGLLALFGGFMFNRFRVTSRQKDVIEEQKGVVEQQKSEVVEAHEQLEERNKEILDSITYAKRIQSAILPPDRIVKEYLSNSFILYKPKDIVAGDFYWMETADDVVYFAAADCTGHGVPGAMVSVVCVNGLNRSVREFGLRDPGQILDKTRELVIKEFEKSEEDVKDGMDISLCALNTKTRELKWAGANNPLWVVTRDKEQGESVEETDPSHLSLATSYSLNEVKADKQPIGKYALSNPFTTHTLQLNEGDTIYTFSDGYPDQFGGENGKKYKSGKFKRTLIEMASKPIDQQRELLDQEFESWKGSIEQIDDVCVIGVRI